MTEIPWKPVAYQRAADWVDANAVALPAEALAVSEAAGRVLAAPVNAPRDHPAAPVAAEDGYALRAGETVGASDYNPLLFRVAEVTGDASIATDAVPVASGQRIPKGADAVMPRRDAERRGEVLEINLPLAAGANVIPAGREAREGETLLAAGRVLRAADIALLIELGAAPVAVTGRPRVAIIVARPDVRDAGGPMIRALVARDGGVADRLVYAGQDELAGMLGGGKQNLILIVGATGPGPNDHAAAAIEQAGELTFRGVAMSPGETTMLGRADGALVIALPGPPLAALFAYDLIAGPAVRRLGGRAAALPYATRRLVLERKIASGLGRLACCRVSVSGGRALPIAVTDHRTLSTAVRADGFVLVPEHNEGFAQGSEVVVYMFDQYDSVPEPANGGSE